MMVSLGPNFAQVWASSSETDILWETDDLKASLCQKIGVPRVGLLRRIELVY